MRENRTSGSCYGPPYSGTREGNSRRVTAPALYSTDFVAYDQDIQAMLSAERRWLRLRGYRRLGEVVDNVRFVDGVREDEVAA